MEIDELEKRINWLDSERQKDKKALAELSDAILAVKDTYSKYDAQIGALNIEVKNNKKVAARVEKADAEFATYRTEILKKITEIEKKAGSTETKLEKQRKEDVDQINKKMLEYQTDVKSITEIKKTLQLRVEEELRISQKVDEAFKKQTELQNADEDQQRQLRSMISDLSVENKRITDIQLETNALRSRIEEDRNIVELHKELIRKLESRLNEIQATEVQRKQDQLAFIEKQSLSQVEKDNVWKDWQKRFNDLDQLGSEFNTQLLELEETHRSVKRSQAEFEEINERFNRRINEITEMNRLSEERFRQEWVTFKADDQKRWVNYTLSREEEQREDERQLTRILDRLVALEDLSQDLNDTLQMVNEETQKQMRGLLGLTQEMLDSYSQSIGKRSQK